MIGYMPTQHVIAMLKAAHPAQAFDVLAAMPVERFALVTTTMDPADLTAILMGIDPRRQTDLLSMLPAERRLLMFQQLSKRQLADLIPAIDPNIGVEMIAGLPTGSAAELLSSMPSATVTRLLGLLPEAGAVIRAMYERHARESVVGAAHTVSWPDESMCDLVAEVLGHWLHVAIRFQPGPQSTPLDVDGAASDADWTSVSGMLLMTNAKPGGPSAQKALQLEQAGRKLEIVQWIDKRDDGTLKRALVRLVGRLAEADK